MIRAQIMLAQHVCFILYYFLLQMICSQNQLYPCSLGFNDQAKEFYNLARDITMAAENLYGCFKDEFKSHTFDNM